MKREVYIDGQQIDIRPDNQAGYMFTSPIFRDITKIISNRTTTYKIPKTAKNIKIFGLSGNPEILSDFPYRTHSFREYRDGLLFIKGACTLLKSTAKDFELSIIWGNTINLLALKDMKLREIPDSRYFVPWGFVSEFIESDDASDYGFIKINYGRGLTDFHYQRPAITIRGILDIIKLHSGVDILYPSRFNEVFKKTWIPLTELNTNEVFWVNQDYRLNCEISSTPLLISGKNWRKLYLSSAWDPKGLLSDGTLKWREDPIGMKINLKVKSLNPPSGEVKAVLSWGLILNAPNIVYAFLSEMKKQKVELSPDGYYHFEMESTGDEIEASDHTFASFVLYFEDSEGNVLRFEDPEIGEYSVEVTRETKEVKWNEPIFAAPNLPDLGVIEFLKVLMNMYGLFAYYNYRDESRAEAIEFLSIDDMYTKYKSQAYDWTHKIIGKMSVSYTYGDYAQVNHFKYAEDEALTINANGALLVNNTTITKEKDIVELPFAPSLNEADENGTFASIKLFNGDGGVENIQDRILTQNDDNYIVDEGGVEKEYVTAMFSEDLHFGGEEGLLNTYYKTFQHVIKRPVVVEFSVYLDEAELHLYREVVPVYVDGIFYMIIEMTAQNTPSGKSLCKCTAIKMPYLDLAKLE